MNSASRGQKPEDALDTSLAFLYQAETPEAFETSWRAAVRREEFIRMTKGRKNYLWKVALPSFGAMVLVIGTLLTGASNVGGYQNADRLQFGQTGEGAGSARQLAASPQVSGETLDYDMQESAWGFSADGGVSMSGNESETLPAEKKIIRTADMRLATTAFDQAEKALRDRVAAFGGTVESSYQFGDGTPDNLRSLSLSLRVPTEKLDEFLSGAAGIGRVTAKSESTTDMTIQYTDTSLLLQTQRDKMARLQQLLPQAETVTELLEIENEIANTQYRIDSYETSLRSIDREVEGSLVSVTLTEETSAQSAAALTTSLGDRIASGFAATLSGIRQFFQNMLVFIVMALPIVLPLMLIGMGIWLIFRIRRKGASKPKDEF